MYDLIIQNARIVDGTGAPAFQGDIGIKDDRIAFVGKIGEEEAFGCRSIDASGKIVTPGFIDPHTHVDLSVLAEPAMEPYLKQGVTTVVTGNCGHGIAPQGKEAMYYSETDLAFLEKAGAPAEVQVPLIFEKEKCAAALQEHFGVEPDWETFDQLNAKCDRLPLGCNMAPLVGFNAVRTAVMGLDCLREATEEEIAAMERETRAAMEAGAFGLSTGRDPIYVPGCFADDAEIRRLLQIVAAYDGIFTSHTYNFNKEGRRDRIGGYGEMIRQAAGLSMKVHVSHAHVLGMAEDGAEAVRAAERTVAFFEEQRKAGCDLSYDVLPSALCTDFTQVSLGYFLRSLVTMAGTRDKLAKWLKEPGSLDKIHEMIRAGKLEFLNADGGACWLQEFSILKHKNPKYKGQKLLDAAEMLQMNLSDALLALFAEDPDMAADTVFPYFADAIDLLCSMPYAMPCSDGASYAKETNLTGDAEMPLYPNSMNIGYLPRYLTRYGKGEAGAFEEAVRKASGFVAERFGIEKRGTVREGNFADLVILDRENLHSFDEDENPLQDPTGIDYVIVNGRVVLEEGRLTGSSAGRVLRKRRP